MTETYDIIMKILLLGESAVGKSNLLLRYSRDEFKIDMRSTIGVEFQSKYLKLKDLNIKAQIWDTAGMERYRSITSAYYRGAKGVIIVYDITRRETFNCVDKWLDDFRENSDKDVCVVLIGNKSDLEEKRMVSVQEGEEKAREKGLAFVETSAKENSNVSNAFESLFEEILRTNRECIDYINNRKNGKRNIIGDGKNIIVENENKNENKGSRCCSIF